MAKIAIFICKSFESCLQFIWKSFAIHLKVICKLFVKHLQVILKLFASHMQFTCKSYSSHLWVICKPLASHICKSSPASIHLINFEQFQQCWIFFLGKRQQKRIPLTTRVFARGKKSLNSNKLNSHHFSNRMNSKAYSIFREIGDLLLPKITTVVLIL